MWVADTAVGRKVEEMGVDEADGKYLYINTVIRRCRYLLAIKRVVCAVTSVQSRLTRTRLQLTALKSEEAVPALKVP